METVCFVITPPYKVPEYLSRDLRPLFDDEEHKAYKGRAEEVIDIIAEERLAAGVPRADVPFIDGRKILEQHAQVVKAPKVPPVHARGTDLTAKGQEVCRFHNPL